MKNGATTKVLRLQVLALTLIQREFDEVKTARDALQKINAKLM